MFIAYDLLEEKGMKYWIEEMRAEEVKKELKKRKTVIVPFAMTEWHERHLPTGTDSYLTAHLCRMIAERTNAMIAPLIPYGGGGYWGGISKAGTIPIHSSVSGPLLRNIYITLAEQGFTHIVFFVGHGPNREVMYSKLGIAPFKLIYVARKKHPGIAKYDKPLEDECDYSFVTDEILPAVDTDFPARWEEMKEWGPKSSFEKVILFALDAFALGRKAISETCDYRIMHADDAETSMMLAIRPDLVDMRLAKREKAEMIVRAQWNATAEKGEKILAAIADESAALVKKVEEHGIYFYVEEWPAPSYKGNAPFGGTLRTTRQERRGKHDTGNRRRGS